MATEFRIDIKDGRGLTLIRMKAGVDNVGEVMSRITDLLLAESAYAPEVSKKVIPTQKRADDVPQDAPPQVVDQIGIEVQAPVAASPVAAPEVEKTKEVTEIPGFLVPPAVPAAAPPPAPPTAPPVIEQEIKREPVVDYKNAAKKSRSVPFRAPRPEIPDDDTGGLARVVGFGGMLTDKPVDEF